MDSSFRHISDSCELSFFSALSISPLSSSCLPLFKNFRNSLSLFQPNMPQNLSLYHVSKKAISNAPITSPSKNECEPTVFQLPTQMWLDLVIKFMIFFSLCDFFANDHPFVSFIARKIIYFFHCIFYLFINLINLLLNVFEIFIMGMKPSTSECVCVSMAKD